jgi:uncharacterized tellurite resistance protein B-like protein
MTTHQKLENLVAKLRALPVIRQEAAIEALSEIVAEPYQLSDDELAALLPALDEADRGEGLSDVETDDILTKPWR